MEKKTGMAIDSLYRLLENILFTINKVKNAENAQAINTTKICLNGMNSL